MTGELIPGCRPAYGFAIGLMPTFSILSAISKGVPWKANNEHPHC